MAVFDQRCSQLADATLLILERTGKAPKVHPLVAYLERNGPTVNAAHQPLLLQFEQITPHAGFRGSENFAELLEIDKLLTSEDFLNLQNPFGLAHVIPLFEIVAQRCGEHGRRSHKLDHFG